MTLLTFSFWYLLSSLPYFYCIYALNEITLLVRHRSSIRQKCSMSKESESLRFTMVMIILAPKCILSRFNSGLLNYGNHRWSKPFYWYYMPNRGSASSVMMKWLVRSDKKCTWQCISENQERNTYSDVWRIYVAELIVFTGSQPHTVFFVWQHIFVPVKGRAVWSEISSLLDRILCQVVLGLLDPDDESATIPWTVRNYLLNNVA